MPEHLQDNLKSAIPHLYSALDELRTKSNEIKKAINTLSQLAGENPPFNDVEIANFGSVSNIAPDQFFGKSFASAVKTFLKMKGKAAQSEEILDALIRGGFKFPTEWTEKMYLKNLAISMSKNTLDFVAINNGNFKAFGLWEFYPEMKRQKEKTKKEKASKEEADDIVEEVNEVLNNHHEEASHQN